MTTHFAFESKHPHLQAIYSRLADYAKSERPVLIEGEYGTGKTQVAKALFKMSGRRHFAEFNCASFAAPHFEAEFLTRLEQVADGGFLFVEEVHEMPLSIQSKFLRVVQDHTLFGFGVDKKIDCQIVFACTQTLSEKVEQKLFRQDLYYCISVIHIEMPALRNRPQDIPLLCQQILEQLSETNTFWKSKKLSALSLAFLKKYSWPGNIRQLQLKIENALISSGEKQELAPKDFQLEVYVLPSGAESTTELDDAQVAAGRTQNFEVLESVSPGNLNLREARDLFEQKFIAMALEQSKGNKTQAAKLLGLSREGLRKALGKKAA